VNHRKLVAATRISAGLVGKGTDIPRHTFASMFLAQWGDLRRLQASMGHETPQVTLTNYYDLIPKEDAEAFWQIGVGNAPG
jgi:integrase